MNSKFRSDSPQAFAESRRLPPNTQLDPNYVSSQAETAMREIGVKKAYKNAGSQFYWIAALSLINSLALFFGGNFHFVAGLGLTQLIDGIAFYIGKKSPDINGVVVGVGLFLDLGILAMIALFGYLATRGYIWPVVTGMILYGLDALLVLSFKDIVGFGFHLFFLWQIWAALKVLRYYRKAGNLPTDAYPQNFGTP